jgi:acyl-CoA thioester hydrolase
MGRSWRTDIKVRWGETDPMGIVFYPMFFTWFDHATHELFASSGRSLLARLREDGTSVPIAECGARFRAPVFADDELVVVSTAAEIRSRFFRIEHVVQRAGEEVATGFEIRVVARLGEGGRLEASRVPDELRAWLEDGGPASEAQWPDRTNEST